MDRRNFIDATYNNTALGGSIHATNNELDTEPKSTYNFNCAVGTNINNNNMFLNYQTYFTSMGTNLSFDFGPNFAHYKGK